MPCVNPFASSAISARSSSVARSAAIRMIGSSSTRRVSNSWRTNVLRSSLCGDAESDVGQLLGDVGAVAAPLDDAERQQALHRLAHRRAGDGELLRQRPLRRHAGAWLELAALDALDEAVADGRAQRLTRDRLEGDVVRGHRRRLYWWHARELRTRPRRWPVGQTIRARVHAVGDTTDTPTYELRPTEARWTHIALRVNDIDASIAWYQTFTPLELLDKRQDDMGFGAWLGQPDSAEQAVHPRARPVPAGHRSLQGVPEGDPGPVRPPRGRAAEPRRHRRDGGARRGRRLPGDAAHPDARSDRLHLLAARSGRQHRSSSPSTRASTPRPARSGGLGGDGG